MTRWGIRQRVTAAFAVVMALLLAAVGVYLHVELAAGLDESLDDNLELRFDSVSQAIDEQPAVGNAGYAFALTDDDGYVQVLDERGNVVLDSAGAGEVVLNEAELQAAGSEQTLLERVSLPGGREDFRVLAGPAQSRGAEVVAVVGPSLEDRDDALARLDTLLAIGLPVTLVLASLAGWAALGAALRPVEAMRTRAAALSAADIDQRLPVPPADDELRRLGETLNAMLDRLETAIQRERTFVDDASHELRTPLALHKTELELALRYATTPAELRKAIGSAIEEADRLAQLAEDLLVVARSERGQLALKPEAVAIDRLLADVATRFEARLAGSGRTLRVEPPETGLEIEADPLRLEQALTNLVDNALRHGEGQVRVGARVEDGRVSLHVEDEGPGFPPEFIEHAFERFSRADAARERGGSGLGLAIVETIAGAHRGRAGAANRSAGGADVWIELPLAFSPASRSFHPTAG
jgi:heavy metal sensor kinase